MTIRVYKYEYRYVFSNIVFQWVQHSHYFQQFFLSISKLIL